MRRKYLLCFNICRCYIFTLKGGWTCGVHVISMCCACDSHALCMWKWNGSICYGLVFAVTAFSLWSHRCKVSVFYLLQCQVVECSYGDSCARCHVSSLLQSEKEVFAIFYYVQMLPSWLWSHWWKVSISCLLQGQIRPIRLDLYSSWIRAKQHLTPQYNITRLCMLCIRIW